MKLALRIEFDEDQLGEVLEMLGSLADRGERGEAGAVVAPLETQPFTEGGAATNLSQGVEEYLDLHRSAKHVADARRLLSAAADSYSLEVGGSKSEPYIMVFAFGPRQIGALAYVRLRSGDLRLRLPKESASNHPSATTNPNQRLYQVDVPLRASTEELLAALAEATEKGRQPGRWMGDPEVEARRAAARKARIGNAGDARVSD